MEENVILFPGMKGRLHLPQSLEEIKQEVSTNRQDFIDNFLTEFYTDLLAGLVETDFKLDKDLYMRYILCVECLKAVLYKEVDGYHPLEDYIDEGVKKMLMDDVLKQRLDYAMEQMDLK